LSRIRRLRFWNDAFFIRSYRFRYQRVSFRPTSFRDSTERAPLFPWRYSVSFEKLPFPIETPPTIRDTPITRDPPSAPPTREREREKRDEDKHDHQRLTSRSGSNPYEEEPVRGERLSACPCQSTVLYHTMSENKGIVPQGKESREGWSWRANAGLSCVGFLACLFSGIRLFFFLARR
jgi:hypothetical protein